MQSKQLSRRLFLGLSAIAAAKLASELSGLDGLVSTASAHQPQKPQRKQTPDLYALLIYPRNDAQFVGDLYKFLREQGLSEDKIELLYLLGQKTQWHVPHIKVNDGATRRGLYNATERLKFKARPQDTLFIYFRHHGTLDSITNMVNLQWSFDGNI